MKALPLVAPLLSSSSLVVVVGSSVVVFVVATGHCASYPQLDIAPLIQYIYGTIQISSSYSSCLKKMPSRSVVDGQLMLYQSNNMVKCSKAQIKKSGTVRGCSGIESGHLE